MARPMPRRPPEMNKVLPANVINALLQPGPGGNATARSAPFLKAFLPERSVVPLSRQLGASARLRALPQALPRRLDLGLGGDAVGPRRVPHALPRLEFLVDGEEVVDLQPVELRNVLELAQVLLPRVAGRHADDLVVAALLVGHPEHPDRAAADQAAGERGFLDQDQGVERVAVLALPV